MGTRDEIIVEALRFTGTLFLKDCPSKLLSEADAVEQFRLRAINRDAILRDATKLLKIVKECEKLHSDRRKRIVGKVIHTRLLAVVIAHQTEFGDTEKAALLKWWENATFRIYGLASKDARSSVGDYVRLAWETDQNKRKPRTIIAEIRKWIKKFPRATIVDGAIGEDRYNNWQGELIYFLQRYEEYLARQAGQKFESDTWAKIWADSPSKSIEHIWPQSDDKRLKDPDDVHRLGNLILLPQSLNSRLKNAHPSRKKEKYRDTGILINQEILSDLDRWGSSVIERREKNLLRWAEGEWGDKISLEASVKSTRHASKTTSSRAKNKRR